MNAYASQASNVLSLDFNQGHHPGEGIVVNGELIPWFGTWCVHPADMVRRDNTSDVMLFVLHLHEANDNTFQVGGGGYSNTLWYAPALHPTVYLPVSIYTASAWDEHSGRVAEVLDVLDAFCRAALVIRSLPPASGRVVELAASSA